MFALGASVAAGACRTAIDKLLIWDVDALNNGGSIFRRDPKWTAPHNAYTSSRQIRERVIARGAPATTAEGLEVRPFADDLPRADRPDAGSIDVPYKSGAASYTYDRETNSDLRSVAGKSQVDAGDGQRVTARNVVVMFQHLSIDRSPNPTTSVPGSTTSAVAGPWYSATGSCSPPRGASPRRPACPGSSTRPAGRSRSCAAGS